MQTAMKFISRGVFSDNEFIVDKNLAYVKPAEIHHKQQYVWNENSTYSDCNLQSSVTIRYGTTTLKYAKN